MSSTLQVITELQSDHYLVTATVLSGGTLPLEIFIYENTGTDALGDFFGTCSVEELGRLQIFTGIPIPTFGNRWCRYGQAKIKVDLKDDPNFVSTVLVTNVTILSKALQTKITTSTNYLIA